MAYIDENGRSTNPTNPTADALVQTGIVAVSGDVTSAGIVTWWRLSGTLDLEALHGAWLGAGLSAEWLPEAPSPKAALRRAVKAREERRILARPLDGGGWMLVYERNVEGAQLEYAQLLRITIEDNPAADPAGAQRHLVVRYPDDAEKPLSDGDAVIARAIASDFMEYQSRLSASDVSGWLVQLAARVSAVALRDTGGVYFVPAHEVATWQRIAAALRSVGAHVLYELPALKTKRAVEAILASVEREATTAAESLEDFSTLGVRGLMTRQEKVAHVEAKVASYEALLGSSLDALRGRLETLRANLALAVMTAQQEDASES